MKSIDEEEQEQRTPLSISNTSGASARSMHEVLLQGVQDEESRGMLGGFQEEGQDRPSSLNFSSDSMHANMTESSPADPGSNKVEQRILKRLGSATGKGKSVSFGATATDEAGEVEGSYVSKGSLVSSVLSYSAAGSAKDESAAAGSFTNKSNTSYEFPGGNASFNGSRASAGYQSQTFDFPDEISGESEQVSLLRGQYDAQIKALEEKYRTLEARIDNFAGSSNTTMETGDSMMERLVGKRGKLKRAGSSILQVFSANGNGDATDMPLEQDTFLLMMISKACSKAWVLGLTNVAFQITLGTMILIDQIGAGRSSSDFNIPFTVKNEVRVGQFLTIILCLVTQRDVLTSIQTFVILNKDSDWDKIIGEEGNKNRWLRFQRVIFPNLLKLLEGLLVMFTTMVIVMQGDNIIELIKGLTALMIISRTDNILFMLADYGFLGQELQEKTIEAKEIDMQADNDQEKAAVRLKDSYTLRSLALLFMAVLSIGWWIYVIINQVTGTYFNQQFPNCQDHFQLALEHFGDGECYGGPLNTFGCGFEGGDCINFNFAHPLCKGDDRLVNVEWEVGNGVCNEDFSTFACDFDGGDCCPATITKSPLFGDGQCNGGIYSTRVCEYDNGDCNTLQREYPDCPLEKLSKISGSGDIILGNSICEGTVYSMAICGYEAGDCDVGQVGQDVRFGGISSGTALFSRMRMSADGSTVVVGQYRTQLDVDVTYDTAAPGLVQLYGHNSTDNLWKRKGNILVGEGAGDEFGQSVATSFDGSIVAVGGSQNGGGGTNSGHVKVFQFSRSESTWIQYGQTIMGQENNELSGVHIDMTSDGSRVAIAAPSKESGKIRIYDIRTDADQKLWVQVGADINGKTNKDMIGDRYLHLNSLDGSRVIFSVGHGYQGKIGRTRVYEFDQEQGEWNQLGSDINSDYFKAAATSADGNRIAISMIPFYPAGNTKGRVEIYEWSNERWSKMTTLRALLPTDGDGFGNSISFSSNGNFLAVGMLKSDCDGESNSLCAAGSVELFQYGLTNTPDEPYARVPRKVSNQFGNVALESESVLDNHMVGVQVSLSSDGSKLSIGGYDISRDAGFFKVYEVDELFYQNCVVRYPEWVGDSNCFDHEPFYSEKCGFDGGDCRVPRVVEGYPECFVAHPGNIGDDNCNDYLPYNSLKCGYDGGDCPIPQAAEDKGYSNCFVSYPEKLGDGECDDVPYDTYDCGFDHGDCLPDYLSPTLSPTISSAPSISAAPTLPPKPTAGPTTEESAMNVKFELLTDGCGKETRWELVDNATGNIIKSQGGEEDPLKDNEFYEEHFALQHCVYYTLTVYDSYGDGIVGGSGGYFKVFVEGKEVTGFSDGKNFGTSDSVTIYHC